MLAVALQGRNPYLVLQDLWFGNRDVRFDMAHHFPDADIDIQDELERKLLIETLRDLVINDEFHEVRDAAAWTLFKLEDKESIDTVIEALGKEKNQCSKCSLFKVLCEWLMKEVLSSDEYTRNKILDCLKNVYYKERIPALRRFMHSMLMNDPELKPFVDEHIGDESTRDVFWAQYGCPDITLDDIKRDETSSDSDDVSAACTLIGELKEKKEIPFLLTALKHDSIDVRNSAMGALREIGDEIAIPYLIEALARETDSNNKRVILMTLAEGFILENKIVANYDSVLDQVAELFAKTYLHEPHVRLEFTLLHIKQSEHNDFKSCLRQKGLDLDTMWKPSTMPL